MDNRRNVKNKTGAHRDSDINELDYYPTPPWATRALMHEVLLPNARHFPVPATDSPLNLQPGERPVLIEPCCGEGHMTRTLQETWQDDFQFVSTDIQDLGFDQQEATVPFVNHTSLYSSSAWVITNPPFNMAQEFMDHFLPLINGLNGFGMVVIIARLALLESVKRYNLFQDYPPALVASFSERVTMRKGRLEKKESGNVAYAWYLWTNNPVPMASLPGEFPMMQIRPCRAEYERDADYE